MKNESLFISAYVHAALWSSTDDKDEPLDAKYGALDFSPELRSKVVEDCTYFLAEANLPEDKMPQAGHDFWLNRNGHGTGFWDKPEIYGEQTAILLAELAEKFGSVDLYVGDDGRIYAS